MYFDSKSSKKDLPVEMESLCPFLTGGGGGGGPAGVLEGGGGGFPRFGVSVLRCILYVGGSGASRAPFRTIGGGGGGAAPRLGGSRAGGGGLLLCDDGEAPTGGGGANPLTGPVVFLCNELCL